MNFEFPRGFEGVWIPKEIWQDKELSILEKCLFSEIKSFSSSKDGCFASNEYFAKFLGVSESAIKDAIKKLKELKYIYVSK